MRRHEEQRKLAAGKGINKGTTRRHRRTWDQAQKRQLVGQWQQSGVSRREFCRLSGLCYSAFLRWSREAPVDGNNRFVEVKFEKEARNISGLKMETAFDLAELVAPNGWRVRLPQNFDAGQMREVLKILDRC